VTFTLPLDNFAGSTVNGTVNRTSPEFVHNLALNKAAKQNSTSSGAVVSRAVDGNTNGVSNPGSVTHTAPAVDVISWREVDLGQKANIYEINFFNRTDCCSDRLKDYELIVSDEPFTNGIPASATKYPQASIGGFPTVITVDRTGRYVRIHLTKPNIALSLSEVEVIGAETALPVHLISFSGNTENGINHLNWVTTEEVNVDRFEIERSSNAYDFIQIGMKQAANTTGTHQYFYVDERPLPGKMCYRLKNIDLDGTYTYSRIQQLSVDMAPEAYLYPNPAKNKLMLKGFFSADVTFKIVGLNRQTRTVSLSNNSIDVFRLADGVYVLQIVDQGQTLNVTFVEQ
jgi:hypothetical protein